MPDTKMIRERDTNKKQGSKSTPVNNAEYVREHIEDAIESAMDTYYKLLSESVAPEVARLVLPQSMYTEFIETASLYAYARLCKLRLGSDAQLEIRLYAKAVADHLEKAFPVSWKALMSEYDAPKNEV